MSESTFQSNLEADVAAIRSLLDRSVSLQEMSNELERATLGMERERIVTSSGLLEHAAATSDSTRRHTDVSVEQTALTREQNRSSTRATELSEIRTDLSRERSRLSAQRTDMARARTDLSGQRTEMAHARTGLSERRTDLAEERNHLASTRTLLSRLRTELARGRTALALVRTGLAFLTLGIALFRLFGPSWWSLFDVGMVLVSLVVTAVGLRGYRRMSRTTAELEERLEASSRPP